MKTNFCISYSCGKDSTLALHRMIAQGHVPVALIVTVNEDASKSWFHGVGDPILDKVSQSLGIPLLRARCTGDTYEAVFVDVLLQAKEMGATTCVFGDIDIEDHKTWGETKCALAGLTAEFPLWQQNRLAITNEFVDAGFKGCIKTVSKTFHMSSDFLGKTLSKEIINEIAALGLDPCGENGEYHSFCYDGPLFQEPIPITHMGIHESEYSYSLVIE